MTLWTFAILVFGATLGLLIVLGIWLGRVWLQVHSWRAPYEDDDDGPGWPDDEVGR